MKLVKVGICSFSNPLDFKIKPGEIFRRMRMTTFIQLVLQVSEINGIGTQDEPTYDKIEGQLHDLIS